MGAPATNRLEDVLLENATGFLRTSEPYQLCIAIEFDDEGCDPSRGGTERATAARFVIIC